MCSMFIPFSRKVFKIHLKLTVIRQCNHSSKINNDLSQDIIMTEIMTLQYEHIYLKQYIYKIKMSECITLIIHNVLCGFTEGHTWVFLASKNLIIMLWGDLWYCQSTLQFEFMSRTGTTECSSSLLLGEHEILFNKWCMLDCTCSLLLETEYLVIGFPLSWKLFSK